MSETVGLCVAPNGKMSVHGDKDICSACKVHCYSKEMQEKIKEVMKYAGPRMLFYSSASGAGSYVGDNERKNEKEIGEEK